MNLQKPQKTSTEKMFIAKLLISYLGLFKAGPALSTKLQNLVYSYFSAVALRTRGRMTVSTDMYDISYYIIEQVNNYYI